MNSSNSAPHRPSTHLRAIPLLVATIMTGTTWLGLCAHASEPPTHLDIDYPGLPEAITSFGAVARDGWLYVYGGHTGKAHEYSIATTRDGFHRLRLGRPDTWETLAPGVQSQGASLIAHRGWIYRIGGMAPRNAPGEDNQLFSLDDFARIEPDGGGWETLVPLPEARSSHDACVAGDTLYVGGGWALAGDESRREWHQAMEVLDLSKPDAGWNSVEQPFRRRAIAMAATGHLIYCIGGMDTLSDTSREVDIYDTETGEWRKGPDLPGGPMNGFGAAACAIGDTVFVSVYAGAILAHRPGEAAWSEAGRMKENRFFHRMVALDDAHVLLIGGASRSEGHRPDLEVVRLIGEH